MDLYEAGFIDGEGKSFPVPGHFADDTAAQVFFNNLAAKSDCKWLSLKKFAGVTVPLVDGSANPINQNYQVAATSDSNIQKKGRATYDTGVARNVITLEIPSPDPVWLKADTAATRESSVEPLGGTTFQLLKSDNGTAATTFRQAHYHEKVRRSV